MENELIDLSDTLLKIYNKNLEFLKENFEDIYIKVDKLSKDINEEKYSVKYSLEYIDGYFDILNLENNTWFYGVNSYDDADRRAEHTNFTKDGSLDLLRKGIDGKSVVGNQSFKDVLPVLDYMNNNIDFDNIEFQKIYKFVFMDVGLGFHIHEIFKKMDPFVTLIIEPELEIFRLSLFTIDYSSFQVEEKKLFLSIDDDKINRVSVMTAFYEYHKYFNYNIKHHLLIDNDSYLKDELIEFFGTNTAGSFPYSLTMENVHKMVKFIKNGDRFLNFNTILEKKILKDKHVLLIAAGPSVDNYIEWIYEHQDKFIIVCVDIIVKKLEKYNIVPDIVVTIDPSYLCAEYLTTKDDNFLDNSTIVLLAQQDEKVMDVIKNKHYYFAQSVSFVKELGFMGSTTNVGAYALLLAIHLGTNKLYTVGNDAAFNQNTGSRYAIDNALTTMDKTEINSNEDSTMVSFDDVVYMEGNLRDKVKTNRVLCQFKYSFETTFEELKNVYDDVIAYNLSDGVKLEGFKPLLLDEINKKIDNFKTKENNIIELMDMVSEVVEKPDFEDDIKILNAIIVRLNKHKRLKIKSRDEFLSKKIDVMIWLLEKCKGMSSELFGNIFLLYTELSDIYINFTLNLKQNNLYNKEHLTDLNIVWTNGVLSVLRDLKKAVK